MSVVPEKKFSDALRDRRATQSFDSTPIPDADLKQILQAGLEAPSGYNIQPWRFVVVRDPEQRKKLSAAAFGQPKVAEAPVVVVACGDTQAWKNGDLDLMLKMAAEHGYGGPAEHEGARKAVTGYLGNPPGNAGGIGPDIAVWANRHTMIAYTTMMWAAETMGYDTAPMEGFLEDKVKETLGIPAGVRVVALLAIGKRKGDKKPYGGRFPMDHTVFGDTWGKKL